MERFKRRKLLTTVIVLMLILTMVFPMTAYAKRSGAVNKSVNNPEFTVQYYAGIPSYEKDGDPDNALPIIDTQGQVLPTNDQGVIAPTAALSSMPYTPDESMAALRYFYYKLGDRLWSDYGFIDAFNLTTGWFDTGEHIAIDQGPIILMIENHRTGLLWRLFMSDADVRTGLSKLGFTIAPAN